jgi:hypothetical protein
MTPLIGSVLQAFLSNDSDLQDAFPNHPMGCVRPGCKGDVLGLSDLPDVALTDSVDTYQGIFLSFFMPQNSVLFCKILRHILVFYCNLYKHYLLYL